MKKIKLIIPVLTGLLVGHIFAEGERPFSVSNTIRFGYDDNTNRSGDDPEASTYIEDIIDFAFNASLSDRTDLVLKTQLRYKKEFDAVSDNESNFHPNLYAVLSHSVSPRMLLRFSEYFSSAEKTTGRSGAGRYNYYNNKVGVVGTYVLDEKNRLELSLDHNIKRHDEEIEDDDYTTIGAGISWARDIRPQRTSLRLNLRQQMVEYDKRDLFTGTVVSGIKNGYSYDSRNSAYDSTEATVELNHTFNSQWRGSAEVGMTYVQSDLRSATIYSNNVNIGSFTPDDSAQINPLVRLGVTYSPSPRTRMSGNFYQQYEESDDSGYGGQTSRGLTFDVQHDVTAKLMAKASVRFLYTEYDAVDAESGAPGRGTEDHMNLDFRLTYKLNRVNFLETGFRHSETTYDEGDDDWTRNMFDVGWRVEL